MELLTPIALLAGAIIPVIIILYMLKKRTRPQVVSSIMLWQRLDRVNRPALRLSKLLQSLLLLLQLLVALLLVLALARPVLNLAASSGAANVIIIDTSISMAVKEKGQTRFEQAAERVRAQIRAKAPGDKIALIAMGEEATVISGFSANSVALLASLAEIDIDAARANPNAALALAANMAAAEEGARVVLYSAGCFGPLTHMPTENVEFIALGEKEVANLLIEDVVPDGERLYVTVANNGTVATAGRIEIRDPLGELVGRREVELEAQQRQVLVWRNLPAASWLAVAVDSKGDQLELDNLRYALVTNPALTKLLLVSEGNMFLERALLLQPGLSVSRVTPAAYSPALATKYELFTFDGFLPPVLPAAPVLVFDPPHPNPHIGTAAPVSIGRIDALPHPLLNYVDLSEVSIGLSKIIIGGAGLIESEQGLLATATTQQSSPLVVFGFAVQAGDLPLRPAFPLLLKNILDSFRGGAEPVYAPKYGQKIPGGDSAFYSFGGSQPLAAGQKLAAGIYTFTLAPGEKEQLIAVNPPITTDGLSARQELASPGGPIQSRAKARGLPLLWPLLLAAFIFVGIEWWVDNYGN